MNKKFIDVINYHIRRYPALEVQDIYKLLYQAANGPRHYINKEFDINEFYRQWNEAKLLVGQPPLEPISSDGKLVRANFAPLRDAGVHPDDVLNAAMLSVEAYIPRPSLLIQWWRDLGDLIRNKIVNLSMREYNTLNDNFQKWGFVPLPHSETYKKIYHPAYIVILSDSLPIDFS